MLLYNKDGVRVIQHPYLYVYHVEQWMEGDDPRSYGRCYKWCTVLETTSIVEVNKKVKELHEKSSLHQ